MKYWHWPNNTHAAHTLVSSDPGFPEYLASHCCHPHSRRLSSRWPLSVSRVKMPAEDGLSGIGALWHGQLEINSKLCVTCQLE